jgi:hypothetical protein
MVRNIKMTPAPAAATAIIMVKLAPEMIAEHGLLVASCNNINVVVVVSSLFTSNHSDQ